MWASSGIGISASGWRRDWAIIKIEDPTALNVAGAGCLQRVVNNTFQGYCPIQLANITAQQLIALSGWRTTSFGVLNPNRKRLLQFEYVNGAQQPGVAFSWGAARESLNHFPLHGHLISMEGDSGSWALNGNGDLIGLQWGADFSHNYAFIIPIQEVIRDIEEQTGYTVVLP